METTKRIKAELTEEQIRELHEKKSVDGLREFCEKYGLEFLPLEENGAIVQADVDSIALVLKNSFVLKNE